MNNTYLSGNFHISMNSKVRTYRVYYRSEHVAVSCSIYIEQLQFSSRPAGGRYPRSYCVNPSRTPGGAVTEAGTIITLDRSGRWRSLKNQKLDLVLSCSKNPPRSFPDGREKAATAIKVIIDHSRNVSGVRIGGNSRIWRRFSLFYGAKQALRSYSRALTCSIITMIRVLYELDTMD